MDKPPENGSSPALTAEQLDRIASLATQTLIEVRRAARIRDADLQLNAREKMALRDMLERVERAIRRANASTSLTVVQDVPLAIEATSARGDEVSVVNLRLPWARGKLVPIPNRLVRIAMSWLVGGLSGGGLIHALHALHVLQ